MASQPDAAFDYAAVITASARRQPDALRALYDHDASRLLGIAYRIVRRRDVAEDIVHELFVELWHRDLGFDPSRGSGRSWLGTIVRNRALKAARRDVRVVSIDPTALERVPDSADDPAAALARLDDNEALRTCLEQLDQQRQSCILLAYVEGLSQTEIAQRLNVPHNTAKSWIRRSLAALRECLE